MFPDVQHSLTQVQGQVQVVAWGRSSVALQGHRERLTPAHDQTLPVDLPGAVSQVVLAASRVDANGRCCWGEQRSEVSLLPGRTGVRSGPTMETFHPRAVLSQPIPGLLIHLTAGTSLFDPPTHSYTPCISGLNLQRDPDLHGHALWTVNNSLPG